MTFFYFPITFHDPNELSTCCGRVKVANSRGTHSENCSESSFLRKPFSPEPGRRQAAGEELPAESTLLFRNLFIFFFFAPLMDIAEFPLFYMTLNLTYMLFISARNFLFICRWVGLRYTIAAEELRSHPFRSPKKISSPSSPPAIPPRCEMPFFKPVSWKIEVPVLLSKAAAFFLSFRTPLKGTRVIRLSRAR